MFCLRVWSQKENGQLLESPLTTAKTGQAQHSIMEFRRFVRKSAGALVSIYLIILGVSVLYGLSAGESLITALVFGVVVANLIFFVGGLLFLALTIGGERQVRIHQGLFLGSVAVSTTLSVTGGFSLVTALWRGLYLGAITYIPVGVILAIIYLVYHAGVKRGIWSPIGS